MRHLFTFTLISLIFFTNQSFASHGMGGEITWVCMPNGQYKFKLVFYRDCNGIAASGAINLTTNVPGTPTISLPRILQEDLSPQGLIASGADNCPNCTVPNSSLGIVQKNVYESAPVTLNGVPPQAGWQFYWGECCRSTTISNIQNPGSVGFRYRAYMYPFPGQTPGICFSSSPFMVEKPMISACTGYTQEFSYLAHSQQGDSLVYEWATPITDGGVNITWSPGYSVNIQLPSSVTYGPAILDPSTGHVSYSGLTGGTFSTSVMITAYRCGHKIAEVFRDIDMSFFNNCPPVSGLQNLPPQVSAPFADPITGLYTSYVDTVYAGDTVEFYLTAQDLQFFDNNSGQTITVEANGGVFGDNFTSSIQGCDIPPCAYFPYPLPSSFQIAGQVLFKWVTTNDHVYGLNTECHKTIGKHVFNVKFSDNYCPANGSVTKTITIYVLEGFMFAPPVLRCASVNSDGSVTLNWSPTTTLDSLGVFQSYKVYASLTPNGPYQFVDELAFGINFTNYHHSAAALNSIFGTDANQQIIYYQLKSTAIPGYGVESGFSDKIATIKTEVMEGVSGEALLSWNPPANPPIVSNSDMFRIYKEYPMGTWTLTDSTTALNWSDFATQLLCHDTLGYRVELNDLSGCSMQSPVSKLLANDSTMAANIIASNPVVCPNSPVTLSVQTGLSYLWSTGETTQSIIVNNAGFYTVSVTLLGGCTRLGSVQLTSGSSSIPVITAPSAMCQGSSVVLNASSGYLGYLWSTGEQVQSINITSPGTYTVTVTNVNGCTSSNSHTITQNNNPAPVITGNSTICSGQSTQLNAGSGYAAYMWNVGANVQILTISSPGTYTVTVSDFNGCTGSASFTVMVHPFPTPTITAVGNIQFCMGDSLMLSADPGYQFYVWYRFFTPIPQATQQNYYAKNRGNYYCVVTDANGCSNSSNIIDVPFPCITPDPPVDKLFDESNENAITVYPNPSKNEFHVVLNHTSQASPQIGVFDLTGRVVKCTITEINSDEYLISGINPGLYILKIDEFRIKILRTD